MAAKSLQSAAPLALLVADAAEDVTARLFQCMALGRGDQLQLETVR